MSNSWGGSEYAAETQDEQSYFNHPGVAITASAGDSGCGVNFPSASQYVTAVGGTTLTKDSSVPRGWDETVWDHSGTAPDPDARPTSRSRRPSKASRN